jgi:hypothetical protein
MTRESFPSISVSRGRPNRCEASADSRTTTAKPIPRHETRKRRGRSGVAQSGWSLGPVRSMTVPSDDWCIVGRSSPSAMIQGSAFCTTG